MYKSVNSSDISGAKEDYKLYASEISSEIVNRFEPGEQNEILLFIRSVIIESLERSIAQKEKDLSYLHDNLKRLQ